MSTTLPDSGSRSSFNTGAVRDAMAGKGLPSRIPPIAIRKIAKRFEDGAIKYPDGEHGPNWMQGIPLSRYYDAMLRHLMQWGEDDQSEDHLGAIGWNMAAASWTEQQIKDGQLPKELDDLPFRKRRVLTFSSPIEASQ